ncbi:MAG: glucose-methanol-choline oxidoreductase [Maricaulis sp.]|jgi:choline dehydrogenase-like flavoprotein|nr:glucose-methanol-choline oxidoreductase [Maricaulis sp.]HAQ35068.1 glucose-methanol-choline oxidoreductase [Alphaproteobacteria bacterium]
MSNATEFDYIIVGAGSAGCVVAESLSRDRDVSICVLEAGKPDTSPAIRTAMLLAKVVSGGPYNWAYETEPQKNLNDRRLFWPRGKTLGGSSSINAMHYMRGAAENFDEWGEMGAEGWSWRDALERFKAMECQQRGADAYHGVDGPLHVQDIPRLNPLTEAFFEAGDQLQYPRNPDFNGDKQYGFGPYQMTMKGPRRWSAADAFLRPAMARGNVTVITEALVHRVILENGRATGVSAEIAGDTTTLTARKEVILSGGAINSPQLLQLSGIGDPDWLKAAGVAPEVDLPGVGRNLQDHLDIAALMRTKSSVALGYSWPRMGKNMGDVLRWLTRGDGDFTVNPVQGGAFLSSSLAGELPDLQLVFIPSLSKDHGRETVWGHGVTLHVCHLYPESRGEIRIKSADPTQYPAIDPNYLDKEGDLTALIDGLEITRRILAAPAFDGERVEEWLPGPDATTRDDLETDIRARAETLYHPTSTCVMGKGELAVVDPECRVYGVKNLRVVDASVMPRLVGGNTNAPTMMIADKAAEMIRASA